MKLVGCVLAVGFLVLLCAGALPASTIPPNDPQIIINDPPCTGSCVPVTGLTFTFSSGPTGFNTLLFQNASQFVWFNILITTVATANVHCFSNIFQNCIVDTTGGLTTIFFLGGPGIPITDTFEVILTGDIPWGINQQFFAVANIPEPGTMALFATGMGFVVVGRALRRRFARRN